MSQPNQYEYIWVAQRRFCDVLDDATNGIAAKLTAIVAADADLAPLNLPAPEKFFPCDNEQEAFELLENAGVSFATLFPMGDDVIRELTGDLDSRTNEHVWTLAIQVALTKEAGNEPVVESWDTLTSATREKRRLSIILGAISEVIARHGRNGVDIISALPEGRPEYGLRGSDNGKIRWGRQRFRIIQYVTIPQFAVSTP